MVRDRCAAAVAVIAVHDTSLGPAHGGIRRWPYPTFAAAVSDVVALAQAMTWKCALAGVPAGGGKAVILDRPDLDRGAAYRLVGRALAQLGGRFFTGPDVGTTAADLDVVAGETSFVATQGGGAGDLGMATARGVFAAMQALAAHLGTDLRGMRIAVQGVGAVGGRLAELLHVAGAELVLSDLDHDRARQVAAAVGAAVVDGDAILTAPCDVFAPCALGGVLTPAVAERLPARGVCGAANNIFTGPDAARVLHDRGIVAVPDFVANAGALIAGATFHLAGAAVPPERIDAIGATATEVLNRARAADLPPSEVALVMAQERVARAREERHT